MLITRFVHSRLLHNPQVAVENEEQKGWMSLLLHHLWIALLMDSAHATAHGKKRTCTGTDTQTRTHMLAVPSCKELLLHERCEVLVCQRGP